MAVSNTPSPRPELDSPGVDKWGYTHVKVLKFSYMWTISNFTFCREEMGEILKSPIFNAGKSDELKWRLELYPKGHGEDSKHYLSIFLSLVACQGPEVTAKFKFSILNAKRKKTNPMEIQRRHTFVRGKSSESHGYTKFMNRDFLLDEENGLLPNDNLTIICDVSIVGDVVNVSGKSDPTATQFPVPECRVIEDLGALFESEKLSDVTLTACGRVFRAHKAILAGRSAVFSAMFDHEMVEQKENRVVISDMEDEVLHEMLRFIYTGKATGMEKMADQLLAAADKYALERLKVMCAEALCASLTVENASDVLVLADLHRAHQLKTRTIEFINMHTIEVMDTAGFKTMIDTNPHLIAEALGALATRKNSDTDLYFDIERRTSQLRIGHSDSLDCAIGEP